MENSLFGLAVLMTSLPEIPPELLAQMPLSVGCRDSGNDASATEFPSAVLSLGLLVPLAGHIPFQLIFYTNFKKKKAK